MTTLPFPGTIRGKCLGTKTNISITEHTSGIHYPEENLSPHIHLLSFFKMVKVIRNTPCSKLSGPRGHLNGPLSQLS